MSNVQTSEFRRLRRVEPISTGLHEHLRTDPSQRNILTSLPDPTSPLTTKTLLRLWLASPWEDYTSMQPASVCGGSSLAYRRGAYFRKVAVRACTDAGGVPLLRALSRIQHPNIATLYDVYCYEDKIFTASEYLEISLVELDLPSLPLEEWEIATVLAEVLKGSAYLLSTGVSCRELSMSDIRISTKGNVKIVLGLEQYTRLAVDDCGTASHAILGMPYVAEIVGEMLLSRYPITNDGGWSENALKFEACCLSGSIASIMTHSFLEQAEPASSLAPRVQFAAEFARLDSLNLKKSRGLDHLVAPK
ncbi:uncharacterized protein BP5553_10474 [Venustampulla echinocandica]|uniref:Protein kinase domain-containing protein n=1 Tax=Venustampulla echinocandica TaxID=2656787 RepID=A0A370T9E6_9HELO|nr:uncharacterized protein BP5553_10474 [Venustampulla echinocandica]RDL30196.1 hypothetical protein BP5553_10474 [Venustampulla echinocandica]